MTFVSRNSRGRSAPSVLLRGCAAGFVAIGVLATYCGVTPPLSLRLTSGGARPVAAFIGDSYTAGAGASSAQTRWTYLVSQQMGWSEDDFGRGGTGYVRTNTPGQPCRHNDSCPNYPGIVDEVAATHPDIVVVAGGQNDLTEFDVHRDLVAASIAGTFTALRAQLPDARIIGIGPSVPRAVTDSVVAFNDDVQGAVRAVGGEFVSLIAPTPVILPDMVLPDRTHVNDAGHAAIAARIVDALTSPIN